jgi:hypothetical protein
MAIRARTALLVVLIASLLSGCVDLLWWPGFGSINNHFDQDIPIGAVAHEIQCELQDFIQKETPHPTKDNPSLLDPNKAATVTLNLQTEFSGSVSYLGINFSKLGFTSLAQLISSSNGVPSLQAKLQGKGTVSSQIEFNIPQTDGPISSQPNTTAPQAQYLKTGYALTDQYEQVSFKKDPKDKYYHPIPPKASTSTTIPPITCIPKDLAEHAEEAYLFLFLKNWLDSYKAKQSEAKLEAVCQTKVTLKTQFQLLLDVSAGTGSFFKTPPIILPISGLNIDASPDYTHSLQVVFSLNEQNKPYCKALQSSSPSNVIQ